MKLGLSDGQRLQVSVKPFDPTLASSDHRTDLFVSPCLSFFPRLAPFTPFNLPLSMESHKVLSHQREEVSKRRQMGFNVSQVPSEEIDTDSISPQDRLQTAEHFRGHTQKRQGIVWTMGTCGGERRGINRHMRKSPLITRRFSTLFTLLFVLLLEVYLNVKQMSRKCT